MYTKEINLERIHFPLHTYHKTKRDLNDEHTSDKSLLSFTGQNPLKILLNPLKLASQIGVEPTTFRLGGKLSIQMRYRYNIFIVLSFLLTPPQKQINLKSFFIKLNAF